MLFVDSHAHLQAPAFATDAPEVVAAARLAGVARLLVPGWDEESSRAAVEMCRSDAAIGWGFDAARDQALDAPLDAAAGIHPHDAASTDDRAWAAISEMADEPRVVAIGETGLDYDRAFSPREAQLANLRRHFELGRRLGKPVILHCRSRPGQRDAHDDLMRELADAGAGTSDWAPAKGRPPALLHSFSGPPDYAERALALGLAISFSGLVFRRGEEASDAVARLTPADRLLVETDSPYLSPPGASRRRNEPQWVAITCRWLADRRGEAPAALGAQLVANYDRIFGRSSGD